MKAISKRSMLSIAVLTIFLLLLLSPRVLAQTTQNTTGQATGSTTSQDTQPAQENGDSETTTSGDESELVPPIDNEDEPQDQVTLQTSEFEGEVIKIEPEKITIKGENDETREVTVPQNIQIEKDGNEVKFEDIKVGDKVNVMLSEDEVLSIDATSTLDIDLSKVLIVAGLALLLFTLLGIIMKKKGQQHIKTAPATLS